jgi:hypothetical protein
MSYNCNAANFNRENRKGNRISTSCRTFPRICPVLIDFFGVFPPELWFSILGRLSFREPFLFPRKLGDLFNT